MASMADKKPEVFVRKASGLIRTAGTWDVLAYNINFTSIGLLLLFLFLFGPAFYPGASMVWATVICVAAILPLALVYGYLASAMPRSGGDYVYVSRVLGPALGMMSNWNMTMWWFFYGGVPSAFLARYGLAPMFRTMGIYTGNATLTSVGNWFTTKAGTFILGTVLIILLIVVFSIGTKTYFRIQNILILFAVASTILTVAVFIGKGQSDVLHAFNTHLAGVSGKANPAAYVVQSAKDAGYTGLSHFSLYWSLLVMTWIYLNLSFMSSSAYIGSEVKDARKLQLWSMPATLFIVGIGVLVSVVVIGKAVGYDFLAQLGWADPAGLGLDSAPTFTELASYVGNNIVLAFLILFGFIFWSYAWLPGQILNGSRNIFAYAIDGLLPVLVQEGQHEDLHADPRAHDDGRHEHRRAGDLRLHQPVRDPRGDLRLHPELPAHLALGRAAALPVARRVRDVGREPAHRPGPGHHHHRGAQHHCPGLHGLGLPARPECRPSRPLRHGHLQRRRLPERPRRVLHRQVRPAQARGRRGAQLQADPRRVTGV